MITIKRIADVCRAYRIKNGYKQRDVADATGYTQQHICQFEHGSTDNCIIMLWYLNHGVKIDDFRGDDDDAK